MTGNDQHILDAFIAARAKGDEDTARRCWSDLVERNYDRVQQWVRIESYGRLSPEEQDDAVQRALVKLLEKMILTFRGTSMGEWVNATKTLVRNSCIDVQRREMKHSRRRAPEDEGSERPLEDDDEPDEPDYSAFLNWAIPQLTPKRRQVMELDRRGLSCEQIQKQLGVSRDVVYASRSRALKDLNDLREGWRP